MCISFNGNFHGKITKINKVKLPTCLLSSSQARPPALQPGHPLATPGWSPQGSSSWPIAIVFKFSLFIHPIPLTQDRWQRWGRARWPRQGGGRAGGRGWGRPAPQCTGQRPGTSAPKWEWESFDPSPSMVDARMAVICSRVSWFVCTFQLDFFLFNQLDFLLICVHPWAITFF